MDVRCEICGCLTEEGQLSEIELSGEKFRVCSYCRKNLDSIAADPVGNAAAAANVFTMENAHRTKRAQDALGRHFASLGIPVGAGQTQQSVTPTAAASMNAELSELRDRVAKLEEKVESYRRRYLISKALEIAIPIVLVVIMLIVMVASGALENIANYYDMIVDYANM